MKSKKNKREEILKKFKDELEVLKKLHEESIEANKKSGFTYHIPFSSRYYYVESQIQSLKRNLKISG